MKKILLLLCFFVILGSVNAQTSTTVIGGETAGDSADIFTGSQYDGDGDGVCDEPSRVYSGIDRLTLGCTPSGLGDLCRGTPSGERVSTFGDRAGCSENQLAGFSNYWGVKFGEPRPRAVKPNWLTDQRQGVKVFQPISFFRNTEYLVENEKIEFRGATVSCRNAKGVIRTREVDVSDFELGGDERQGEVIARQNKGEEYVPGNYGSVSISDINRSDLNMDLLIRLNYQRDESLVRPKNILNYRGEFGIDEIEFECTARINQCRRLIETVDGVRVERSCIPVYPQEVEEFPLRVALDGRAFKAPEAFLEQGIETATDIIDFTNKVEPQLRKFYGFFRSNCLYAIGVVLGGKYFSFIPGLDDLSNFIWQGPEKLSNLGLYKDSFIISGRSVCSAVACPRDWCRLLNWHPGGGQSLYEITGGEGGKPIQDSLVLSSACGCVSGLLAKLYQIEAIALKWRTCMQTAVTSGEYVNDCDRYLSQGICEFIMDEVQYLDKFDFGLLSGLTGRGDERGDPVLESTQAGIIIKNDGTLDKISRGPERARRFAETEVATLGAADIKGVLGYENHVLASSFCALALYGDLPEFSSLQSIELGKNEIQTTTSSNFEFDVAYFGEGGRPVYGYDISWMIVSGRKDLRYNVYLESDQGAKRPIHTDILAEVGDFDSDYVEITDDIEYTKICFDLRQEAKRIRCYPPGGGTTGGLFDDLKIFRPGETDSDEDRLPDAWENRFSCYEGREKFENIQDENACKELLSKGKENRLDPGNPNTDSDRIFDASEDPDGDGFNNYQEYQSNTPPNSASSLADGGSTLVSCYADFGNFKIIGGESSGGNVDSVFRPGDSLSVAIENINLLSGTANVGSDDVFARIQVTGPRLFDTDPVEIPFDQAASGVNFVIWQIPSKAPPSGVYDVVTQLVVPGNALGFGKEICRDKDGVLSEMVKKIILYNGECVDSDDGDNFRVGGVCADSAGSHFDSCNVNVASDFYCADNSCQSLTNDCGLSGNSCVGGACVSG